MAIPVKKSESTTPSTKIGGTYTYGLGRRKRAVAQVRLYSDKKVAGSAEINGKQLKNFFPIANVADEALAPLKALNLLDAFFVTARVVGGGVTGQAGAISLGIARALQELDPKHRAELKKRGFLTRDPREKERKKYNLHSARKAHQYTKR